MTPTVNGVRTLIYVMSLGHSGSTVFSLMLGNHPRLVGLGEVYHLVPRGSPWLDRTGDVTCTCGQKMDACLFWGPTCEMLRESPEVAPERRYAMLLERFWEFHGDGVMPVDASKTLMPLRLLEQIPDLRIEVLLLFRDVRGWTVSHRDLRRRAGEYYLRDLLRHQGPRGIWSYPKRMAVPLFLRWYLGNRAFEKHLSKNSYRFLDVGYEELCLYPRPVMIKICEHLDIEFGESMLSPVNTGSHAILGNRMRVQSSKRSSLMYDHRWFYRNEWILPAALLPGVMRYNADRVYQLTGEVWKR